MKQMYNVREGLMSILVMLILQNCEMRRNNFPEFNRNVVKEGINFPLYSSLRAVKWLNRYLFELKSCVEKLTQERIMTSIFIKLFQLGGDYY